MVSPLFPVRGTSGPDRGSIVDASSSGNPIGVPSGTTRVWELGVPVGGTSGPNRLSIADAFLRSGGLVRAASGTSRVSDGLPGVLPPWDGPAVPPPLGGACSKEPSGTI